MRRRERERLIRKRHEDYQLINLFLSSCSLAPFCSMPSEPNHVLCKLIVCYNGTRFNGFQRQVSHAETNSSTRNSTHTTSNSSTSNSTRRCLAAPPKRPHWERDRHQPHAVHKKRVPHTIQDCLEDAILSWIHQTQAPPAQQTVTQQQQTQQEQQPTQPAQQTVTQPPLFSVAQLCLRAAGRTDKGVHARGQVVTVYLPATMLLTTLLVPRPHHQVNHNQNDNDDNDDVVVPAARQPSWWAVRHALNSRLPWDISVTHVQACHDPHDPPRPRPPSLSLSPPLFHPRNDAVWKEYSYTIKYRRNVVCQSSANNINTNTNINNKNNATVIPIGSAGPHSFRNALDDGDGTTVWLCPWALEDTILPSLCHILQGRHNFDAFVHKSERNHATNQKTNQPTWTEPPKDDDDDGGGGSRRRRRSLARHEMELQSMTFQILETQVDYDEEEDYHRYVGIQSTDQSHTHHSSSFQPPPPPPRRRDDDNKNNNKNNDDNDDIRRLQWQPRPMVVLARFRVRAPSFKRSMVRNLVGFCVDVARNCDDLAFVRPLLSQPQPVPSNGADHQKGPPPLEHPLWTRHLDPDSSLAQEKKHLPERVEQNVTAPADLVRAAPACGLCLEYVHYHHNAPI